jgi:hypothetical protein
MRAGLSDGGAGERDAEERCWSRWSKLTPMRILALQLAGTLDGGVHVKREEEDESIAYTLGYDELAVAVATSALPYHGTPFPTRPSLSYKPAPPVKPTYLMTKTSKTHPIGPKWELAGYQIRSQTRLCVSSVRRLRKRSE